MVEEQERHLCCCHKGTVKDCDNGNELYRSVELVTGKVPDVDADDPYAILVDLRGLNADGEALSFENVSDSDCA